MKGLSGLDWEAFASLSGSDDDGDDAIIEVVIRTLATSRKLNEHNADVGCSGEAELKWSLINTPRVIFPFTRLSYPVFRRNSKRLHFHFQLPIIRSALVNSEIE